MKTKILAVDDSKAMLRIISDAIELLDYEPLKAANGLQALDIMETEYENIALILLDWNMPRLNGLETLKRLKEDPRYREIPVMMVTTESEQRNIIKAIRTGAKHYLTKPFSQQDLTLRIMETMGMGG